ncbi:MAG: alpha/beta hydrolase [Solirubrobacteraceae bacterium]|nr:alpha/beta hydrolase [Solirubrobacteraceae bacterium]
MPALEGVEHRFLDVRGARLHVAELGDPAGAAVLLLHGWPQHWWCWRRLMPLLADRHRVLAMDLRGFGWSEPTRGGYRKEDLAEDVVGVLDALGVERANLVGHDWGGIVGLLVCLDHPARVERFAPMNTGHLWPTVSPRGIPKALIGMTYQGLLASPVVGRRINASPRVVGKVVDAISTGHDVSAEYARQFAPRFADPDRARAASQVYRTFLVHEYPYWVRGRYAGRRVTTPLLWLHGLKDPFLTPGMFKDIREHADDVRIEYLPEGAHFPAEECPHDVAGHLRGFFSSAAHISPRD